MYWYYNYILSSEDQSSEKYIAYHSGDYDEFPLIPRQNGSESNQHSIIPRANYWNIIKDGEILFSGNRQKCCICFIDMMNSTKTVSRLNDLEISNYYSIFLNAMASIAKNFGATIIKNAGDCLIYYFPNTFTNPLDSNKFVFQDVIECGITTIAAHSIINSKMTQESLPPLNYRISADYGMVELAKSSSSKAQDLFGSTVNICSKINSKANPNGMAIGKNLYDIVKSYKEYIFEEIARYTITSDQADYPIYSVALKDNRPILNPFKRRSESNIQHGTSTYSSLASNNEFTDPIIGINDRKIGYDKESKEIKILIVEDQEDNLQVYKKFLESGSYIIEGFSDPVLALERFEQSAPYYYDLIILDIKMPKINGVEFHNKIKSRDKGAKVLFISGIEGADIIIDTMSNVKMEQLVKKPIERKRFIHAIESAIKGEIEIQ